MYKPTDYNSLSPYLVVEDALKTIEFLKTVFAGEELRRYHLPDGSIIHAEVKIDDTVVMLSPGGEHWPAIPSHVHVYVPDVDATYRKALEAGGTSAKEPAVEDGDPDRRGGVKGPGGITWWMSTQLIG